MSRIPAKFDRVASRRSANIVIGDVRLGFFPAVSRGAARIPTFRLHPLQQPGDDFAEGDGGVHLAGAVTHA